MARTILTPNMAGRTFITNFGISSTDVVQASVYNVLGVYQTTVVVNPSDWYVQDNTQDLETINNTAAATFIDMEAVLRKAGFTSGDFKVRFHFLRQQLINIAPDEISEDNKEIKLIGETSNIGEQTNEFNRLYNRVLHLHKLQPSQETDGSSIIPFTLPLVINEGGGEIAHIINLAVHDETITGDQTHDKILYLKLLTPLKNTGLGSLDIASLCADIIEINVSLRRQIQEEGFRLLHPNFDLSYDFGAAHQQGEKTWNEILGSGTTTSQELISRYVSSSWGTGAKLNIDYRDYKNFIHFSSAEERLRNFHYKMTLLEDYRTDNATLSSLSGAGAEATGNIDLNNKKINDILHGFDDYEKYLYYSSGSDNAGNIKYETATWPKYNNVKPYSNISSSQTAVQTCFGSTDTTSDYFGGQIYSASIYDRDNEDMLLKALPQFITNDGQNQTIFTYMHMMGQHYDILFNYIKHMTTMHSRDEDPDDGAPREMIFPIAQSLGLQLFNGNVNEDLWQYALGTAESGTTTQTGLGTASGSLQTISGEHRTQEIWNRLINNLPMLLKSKGTERSIRALINCYGIPSTILRIIEYGGPDLEGQNSQLAINRHCSALRFGNLNGLKYLHGSSNVYTDKQGYWSGVRPIKTMEMRIQSTYKQNQVLWSAEDGRRALLLEHSASGHGLYKNGESTYARLKWHVSASAADAATGGHISCSTDYTPLLDGDWWNIMVQFPDVSGSAVSDWPDQPQQFNIFAKKAADHSHGRITHAVSGSTEIISGSTEDGSTDGAWRQWKGPAGHGNDLIGGRGPSWAATHIPSDIISDWDSNAHFSGSMQEFRIWTTQVGEAAFDQHIQNPNCIVGNTYSSSYYDIATRFRMGTDLITTTISGSSSTLKILSSSHPQHKEDFGSTSSGYDARYMSASVGSAGGTYVDVEEVYYINMPSTVGGRPMSNKIRIENNALPEHLGGSGEMHTHLSYESKKEFSSLDTAPIDTNKLGIYLSPTNDINIDIANNIGQTRLDQFVGDPRDEYNETYKELETLRNEYFRRYAGAKNLWDYIRQIEYFDGSLFKILNKFVPNKANELSGLLIEPTILERTKVTKREKPVLTEDVFDKCYTIHIDHFTTSSNDMFETASYQRISGDQTYFSGSVLNIRNKDLYNSTKIYNFTSSEDMGVSAGVSGTPFELSIHGSGSISNIDTDEYTNSDYPQKQLITHTGVDGYTQGSQSFQLTPVDVREALDPCITGSRKSQMYKKRNYFYSSSLSASYHQLYLDTGEWMGPYAYAKDVWSPVHIESARLLHNGQFGNILGSFKFQAYSSSMEYAETTIDDNVGSQKMLFTGCQLQGDDFNKPTPQTPDGGAVVEFFETNPNELFSAGEAVPGKGEILLSGELPLTTKPEIGGNKGDIIPGSQQPGPQGQANGYWYNNGHSMVWVTASPPNTSWAGASGKPPPPKNTNKNNNTGK